MRDITIRRPIKWLTYADTHVGMIREVNEDSICSISENGLWAIADGMGGYEAGDVASNMIVKTLAEIENLEGLNDFVEAVENALIDVNHRILEYADIMLDGGTLGSTVVALIIRGRVGACLWVGDSRLYRLRNGNLLQLSRDHSQVEEMIQQGHLTPEEAEGHPDSNVITRAVGADKDLYIDINVFSTQIGDTFLLCSDGLYGSVESHDFEETLKLGNSEELLKTLLQKALENGADDNVSIIVVKGEQGERKRKTAET